MRPGLSLTHWQRPEGTTGKRPAHLNSSSEELLPGAAQVDEEPEGDRAKPLGTHLELGAPAAGGHDCVLPRPAPGPLASLPVLYLLLMFPGDTAPISFEKPCLQSLNYCSSSSLSSFFSF